MEGDDMSNLPEPHHFWDAHCTEQERQLAKYPVCAECGEPITTAECFQWGNKLICEDCIEGHRVYTDDFME
jgi:formylmethanofuran dehydrogenase subunit E